MLTPNWCSGSQLLPTQSRCSESRQPQTRAAAQDLGISQSRADAQDPGIPQLRVALEDLGSSQSSKRPLFSISDLKSSWQNSDPLLRISVAAVKLRADLTAPGFLLSAVVGADRPARAALAAAAGSGPRRHRLPAAGRRRPASAAETERRSSVHRSVLHSALKQPLHTDQRSVRWSSSQRRSVQAPARQLTQYTRATVPSPESMSILNSG